MRRIGRPSSSAAAAAEGPASRRTAERGRKTGPPSPHGEVQRLRRSLFGRGGGPGPRSRGGSVGRAATRPANAADRRPWCPVRRPLPRRNPERGDRSAARHAHALRLPPPLPLPITPMRSAYRRGGGCRRQRGGGPLSALLPRLSPCSPLSTPSSRDFDGFADGECWGKGEGGSRSRSRRGPRKGGFAAGGRECGAPCVAAAAAPGRTPAREPQDDANTQADPEHASPRTKRTPRARHRRTKAFRLPPTKGGSRRPLWTPGTFSPLLGRAAGVHQRPIA